MHPPAVFEQSGIFRRQRVAGAAICAWVAGAVLLASSAAATSPTARACPSASVVDAALGQKHLGVPVATHYLSYAKTCTYRGYSDGGAPNGSMTVTFQVDTAKTFAASEQAVAAALRVTVHGLGQAAWASGVGSLYVFDGHETIKILALLTPTSKLEVLTKKLL